MAEGFFQARQPAALRRTAAKTRASDAMMKIGLSFRLGDRGRVAGRLLTIAPRADDLTIRERRIVAQRPRNGMIIDDVSGGERRVAALAVADVLTPTAAAAPCERFVSLENCRLMATPFGARHHPGGLCRTAARFAEPGHRCRR